MRLVKIKSWKVFVMDPFLTVQFLTWATLLWNPLMVWGSFQCKISNQRRPWKGTCVHIIHVVQVPFVSDRVKSIWKEAGSKKLLRKDDPFVGKPTLPSYVGWAQSGNVHWKLFGAHRLVSSVDRLLLRKFISKYSLLKNWLRFLSMSVKNHRIVFSTRYICPICKPWAFQSLWLSKVFPVITR